MTQPQSPSGAPPLTHHRWANPTDFGDTRTLCGLELLAQDGLLHRGEVDTALVNCPACLARMTCSGARHVFAWSSAMVDAKRGDRCRCGMHRLGITTDGEPQMSDYLALLLGFCRTGEVVELAVRAGHSEGALLYEIGRRTSGPVS